MVFPLYPVCLALNVPIFPKKFKFSNISNGETLPLARFLSLFLFLVLSCSTVPFCWRFRITNYFTYYSPPILVKSSRQFILKSSGVGVGFVLGICLDFYILYWYAQQHHVKLVAKAWNQVSMKLRLIQRETREFIV